MLVCSVLLFGVTWGNCVCRAEVGQSREVDYRDEASLVSCFFVAKLSDGIVEMF